MSFFFDKNKSKKEKQNLANDCWVAKCCGPLPQVQVWQSFVKI